MSDRLLEAVCQLAKDAGELVLQVYRSDFEVLDKDDGSPVTLADRLAEDCILEGLGRISPGVPVVAEEAIAAGHRPQVGDVFWLVDPLDGTREFVSRNGEFTVNIALIESGRPRLGVVLAPALGCLFAGGRAGQVAFREMAGTRVPIRARPAPPEGITVIASRAHGDAQALDAFLTNRKVAAMLQAGSSLKLCRIAEGAADLYPRFGRTMEWDIAAGQAVLEAAGGRVETLDGAALGYGKPDFENPHFVACGV